MHGKIIGALNFLIEVLNEGSQNMRFSKLRLRTATNRQAVPEFSSLGSLKSSMQNFYQSDVGQMQQERDFTGIKS
jgi:hypothetical protein